MAAHTFTANRADQPHWPSVLATLRGQDATAGLMPDGMTATVDKATDWTLAQVAAVQNVIDTAPSDTPQIDAQFQVDQISLFDKALVLTLLDQINVLRAKAGLATVSVADAIAALRAKAGTLS